jgi:tetratricopeptide (TPR) repeat protein
MLDAYQEALQHAAEGDFTRRSRLYSKIADAWVGMNQLEPAYRHYALAESVLEDAPQRDSAWWLEWLGIKLQQIDLYYWQNRPGDMTAQARRIQPLIEQHGSATQRARYLYLMGLMALRRDRYLNSQDAVTYAEEALALSQQTGNLRDTAYRYFNYAFSLLWIERFDEAERYLQIARERTEQSGDLALLTRVITYLAVVYRKREETEHVREYAAHALRIAFEANMPQYAGMAHAQYAWLAWRVGDLAEAKQRAEVAIEYWDGLGPAQSVIPFQWTALFPLMGVALQCGDIGQAARCAQRLLAPELQGLPADLATLLEHVVAVSENGQRDAVKDTLHQALRLARELHYI